MYSCLLHLIEASQKKEWNWGILELEEELD